ncbi:hypothetical protein N658DRAFT_244722 [Parathielavia hyrcaniae]|uniref:Uncharacterized protein n=1 Tax=Parathielavia hyrcaniae TaxID=113614 RepID=A0AAN6Q5Z4_9PEZI|nr:hypothetical protein N658DRAFT_244722 [Parathielavia hyrcaniae]
MHLSVPWQREPRGGITVCTECDGCGCSIPYCTKSTFQGCRSNLSQSLIGIPSVPSISSLFLFFFCFQHNVIFFSVFPTSLLDFSTVRSLQPRQREAPQGQPASFHSVKWFTLRNVQLEASRASSPGILNSQLGSNPSSFLP